MVSWASVTPLSRTIPAPRSNSVLQIKRQALSGNSGAIDMRIRQCLIRVQCWGYNAFGQLGSGNSTNSTSSRTVTFGQ